MLSPSSWEAISIRYLELKLISSSCSNLTLRFSFPSPLLVLLTDKSRLSLEISNFTPSFLSRETDATLSTEFKKLFKLTSNFFLIFFRYYLNVVWEFSID